MYHFKKYFWLLPFLAVIYFLFFYDTSRSPYPRDTEPVTDSLLIQNYPSLYEAVFARDTQQLQRFLDHPHEQVARQAWRALANTPAEDLGGLTEKAMEANTKAAWFAISLHALTGRQLRYLEEQWIENPKQRAGISLVLGREGDERSMDFLFDRFDETAGSDYEYAFALALGRLMTQFRANEAQQEKLIERSFALSGGQTTRAYLYGYYRRNVQEFTPRLQELFYRHWQGYGMGISAEVDQYVARILGPRVFDEIVLYYNGENLLNNRVQLSVELAQTLGSMEVNQQTELPAKLLLSQPHPHIRQQTLASLGGKLSASHHLYRYIRDEMLPDARLEPVVWLEALKTVARVHPAFVDDYEDRLVRTGDENPHLLETVLSIFRQHEAPEAFLKRIEKRIDGTLPHTVSAVQVLEQFWAGQDEGARPDEMKRRVKMLAWKALELNDRSVTFALRGLLGREDLFTVDDFGRINRALSAFRLPEDVEVYQAFGRLYKQRFEEQAAAVIDSLAGLNYAPLNRSLAEAGWEVTVPGEAKQAFRKPDWDELWRLGAHPVWVLETEKGVIKVRLDLLTAPVTVGAIDSLTRAGVYNGVPFHRVVPNFVIQGGDIERGDGMGGPDFVLPTEGSEIEYARGMAGMASAGTDMEGSQYFFMHQWKPHLNGLYTLFGEVIEGMDVVDRIVAGDTVRYAYWQ